MCKIKEALSKKFDSRCINIEEIDIVVGNKKQLPKTEWKINFIVEQDEKGVFLQYYGIHSRNIHVHERIYDDGQEQILDVLQEYIAYCPSVPGDKERKTQEFERYNKTLLTTLKKKQLL